MGLCFGFLQPIHIVLVQRRLSTSADKFLRIAGKHFCLVIGLLRGVTRLDGTRVKKQFWRPHELFRKQMYCIKKVLVTLLGLFGGPAVIPRPSQRFGTWEIVPPSLRPSSCYTLKQCLQVSNASCWMDDLIYPLGNTRESGLLRILYWWFDHIFLLYP